MNQNFINIENETIQAAIKERLIEKVGENYRNNGNIYYRLNGVKELNNTILMRVKETNYILIDEFIEHNGKQIEIVPILLKMSFHINKTKNKEHNSRERVKACVSILGKQTGLTI